MRVLSQRVNLDYYISFEIVGIACVLQRISGWISPSLEVCEKVTLPLVSMKLERRGEALDVPYPSSHVPTQPVKALLLSHVWRQGQVSVNVGLVVSSLNIVFKLSNG